MAVKTLMLVLIGIALASCQTIDKRASAAAAGQGQARASIPFPDLPEACVAKIGRVRPGGEPWVITFKRWEYVADNRDRQADDCAAWGSDMKSRYAGTR